MLDLLPVPLQLASLGFESKHGVGVEIVALAVLSPDVSRRIGGPVEHRLGGSIISARQPGPAAAIFGSLFSRPALQILLDRVELPLRLTGVGIHAVNLSRAGNFGHCRTKD